MDHSGSMGDPRARAVQEAAEQFIKLKKTEDAICFVKYDNHVVVEGPLSYDQNTLISQLKKNGLEDFGGGTAVHDGISGAVEHLNLKAQSFKRKVVIVFTDGQENSSDINKDSLIKYALKSNTLICAVDFGDGIREGYMAVSYTHLRAHETVLDLVCRLLLEKKKEKYQNHRFSSIYYQHLLILSDTIICYEYSIRSCT